MRRDDVQSLHRALDVLFLVATYERSISAADIAAAVGLPRPTVYRIVNTLASRGLVAWHKRQVRATPKLYLMTAGGPRTFRLAELIDPYLMRLVELTASTAGLHERLGYLRRTVHEVAGLHHLDPARGVGFTAPMWLGAVGHVLLAGLREDELGQLLDRVTFPRLTTHSVRDRAELLDRVASARERGWSISNSETVEGVCGAAVPLKQNGRTVAAINLCGPSEREPVIKGWVPELVQVANDASHAWTAVTRPDGAA